MIAQTGVELGQSTDHDRGGEGGKENYISAVSDRRNQLNCLLICRKLKREKGERGRSQGEWKWRQREDEVD